MSKKNKVTVDHEEIKQWVEDRGGRPASVKRTQKNGDPGLLRINFPGFTGDKSIEDISWESFFSKFDEKKLAFLHRDVTATGKESRFFKFVKRDDRKILQKIRSYGEEQEEE